jgi:hypothetical protein
MDSDRANAGLLSKLLLRPTDKTSCSTTLRWGDAHLPAYAASKENLQFPS